MMKTKSAVRPRDIQRIDLNLEPVALGASSVDVGMVSFQMVRRDEGRHGSGEHEKLHVFSLGAEVAKG